MCVYNKSASRCPVFSSMSEIAVNECGMRALSKANGPQCYCAEREMTYCARVRSRPDGNDENDESSGCRESMSDPRECKCKIEADPFFPRLSRRTVSARLFSRLHKLHHQSPRFVHSPFALLSSCVTLNITNRIGPADKLISTGKSCSSSCTFRIRVPPSENPSPQSGTKNLIRSRPLFFRLLSHEHVAVSPFAFYSSPVTEKAAVTLSAVR